MTTPRDSRAADDAAADATRPIRLLPQEYVPDFPLAELEPFPGNPKDHDLGLLDESFDENGWYGAIVAQRRHWRAGQEGDMTVHQARCIAGHGRFRQLRARGVTHAPVLVVDCSDAIARKIVLIDNRASERGGFNLGALSDFLEPMAGIAGALRGTGYDADDLDDFRALLKPFDFGAPAAPSEQELPYKPHETILVHVKRVDLHTAATAAIAEFVKTHPEWEASVVTR